MPSILWGWSEGWWGRALGGCEARWCHPNPAPCGPAAAALLPERPGPLRLGMRKAAGNPNLSGDRAGRPGRKGFRWAMLGVMEAEGVAVKGAQ